MIDKLPTEIIPMIFEHLDVRSKENFVLVCKRFLHVIRCDPKLTIKSMRIGYYYKYDVDFVNAMLLNWPSLKDLTLGMNTGLPYIPYQFLKNVKFEHCDSLESVEVQTWDMTREFYSKGYHYIEGK